MTDPISNLSFLLSAKQTALHEAALQADFDYLDQYGDTNWMKNDSGWQDYCNGIHLKGAPSLSELVENNRREGDAGIDIAGGSNAVAVRELLDSGVLAHALVTNYEDLRNPEVKADQRLQHIDGDLTLPRTWGRILDWQLDIAPEGVGLILHRPHQTLQDFSPTVYHGATNLLIDRLRPGGIFFSQVPSSLNRSERRSFCRELEERQDVSHVFKSSRRFTPYGHAVIIKAAS